MAPKSPEWIASVLWEPLRTPDGQQHHFGFDFGRVGARCRLARLLVYGLPTLDALLAFRVTAIAYVTDGE